MQCVWSTECRKVTRHFEMYCLANLVSLPVHCCRTRRDIYVPVTVDLMQKQAIRPIRWYSRVNTVQKVLVIIIGSNEVKISGLKFII